MPASSPACTSTSSASHPRRSKKRRYMRRSISAQSCDSVPPAPGWMETMASRSSCSPESFMVSSISLTSASSWATSCSISSSTCSPSRWSSSSASRSSDLAWIDSPAAMRFSTRERLRPTSCAFSGSFQKPGADISRSISSKDFFAEARSKIAPDRGEAVFEDGDFLKSVVFHRPQKLRTQNANAEFRKRILTASRPFSSFCIRILRSKFPRPDGDEHQCDRDPRNPIPIPHICRHRRPRLEPRVYRPLPVHRQLLDDPPRRRHVRADPRRRRAQEITIRLDGAEASLIQMLPRRRRAVVPGVVRDRHEDVGAVHHLAARDLRVDDFVADRRAVAEAAVERRVAVAELELADLAHQLVGEEEHLAQRHVLAERHEADLVVVPDRLPVAHQKRCVPHLRRIARILGDRPE